jgi:hypothetical protein
MHTVGLACANGYEDCFASKITGTETSHIIAERLGTPGHPTYFGAARLLTGVV